MAKRLPIAHTLITEPAPPNSRIRPSKAGGWRALVLIGVHILIGLHITHWLVAGETVTPVEPSEAMAFARSSVINAGLIFFAAMILLTAVFGRYFCGWGCHLVALQDLCRHWMLKLGITPKPLRSRMLAWVPALAFFYMFLWPAVYRAWIGDDWSVRAVELTTSAFWATFPGWIVGGLTFLICGFACVYFLGAKGFCTYACPYGAIFAAADRVAPMRIRVTDACSQCGHCTAVCSSNVRVHEEVRDWGMVVSPGCMKCHDCVSVCPKGALYYGAGPIPLFAKPRREPSERAPKAIQWREEWLLASVFAATFLIARGLYGLVPFLMALGVAGVVAFLALTTLRLWTQPTLERPGLRLKRGGRLLPAGRLYLAMMALLLVFLLHSAVLRWHDSRADAVFQQAQAARVALLAAPGQTLQPSDADRTRLRSGLDSLKRVEDWGLFVTYGAAARRAWLAALLGEVSELPQYTELAIARGELPAEMYQLRAHAALLRGNSADAISFWHRAIELAPEHAEPALALGLYLAQSGSVDGALTVFDTALTHVPGSPELWYNAGLARALSGQAEAAIPQFQEALRLRPSYLEARENLAGLYASLGRYAESAEQFRLAIEQSPRDADTRVLYARVLIELGQLDSARTQVDQALAIDATNANAAQIHAELTGRE